MDVSEAQKPNVLGEENVRPKELGSWAGIQKIAHATETKRIADESFKAGVFPSFYAGLSLEARLKSRLISELAMSTRQARWQEERKRRGLCIRCGLPRPPELNSYCIDCAVKRREQRRTRLGSKGRRAGAKTYQLSAPVRKPIERAKPVKKTIPARNIRLD
jgi:hypothetical protein